MKKIFVFVYLMMISTLASAQMFSVQSVERVASDSKTYFRIGTGFNSFDYTGRTSAVANTNRLDFNHNSLNIQVESATTGFELGLNISNHIIGLKDNTYFNLSIYYTNALLFLKKERIQMGVPIKIGSELITVTGDNSPDRFSQTALSLGAGAYMNVKIKEKISFTNYFTPGYGFSSSSGGFFGGSMGYLVGKSRINFLSFIGNKNLSIGYDFKKFMFDIDKDKYDYNLKTHLISIGISF